MSEDPSNPKPSLASFYEVAENYRLVEDKEISPSLYALSQISDRYGPAEFVAKGGMKQIFKVFDSRCKRVVAMAKLHDEAPIELSDPLIHEAWLTAKLDHPNIIKIHDVGVNSDNHPFFTMDLKSGYSLRELLEKLGTDDQEVKERYSLASLLGIFVKVCDAVAYAHSVNVVHFDLKPANIQVGGFGEVLVCDWGLGRVLRCDDGIEFERLLLNSDLLSSNTLFGEVRGTPGYMAPEQFEKEGHRDKRTDIYQLGCILYSILTLKNPLQCKTEETISGASLKEMVPPRERSPSRNIPASLDAVVRKAMAFEPDNRYPTVELLGEEVQRFLTGFATLAEDAGPLTQLDLFYKRNRRLCIAAIAFGLALLCGAVWSYWTLSEKEQAASSARLRAEQTLALYEAGREERNKLSAKNAESIERAVVEMHLAAEEKRPRDLLLAALEAEPSSPILSRAIGEHFFIAQRFNEATHYLAVGEKRDNFPDQLIADLAQKYARIKPDDDQLLEADQLIMLLREIKNFNGFEAMIIVRDQKHRRDPREQAAIVEEHLRSVNPDWHDGWFEYEFQTSRLKVGGKGLNHLSESGSVLAGLQIKILDVSKSDIRELWRETYKNSFEIVDIRGCHEIEDLYFLERLVYLKTLIVHPGQFEPGKLDFLPQWVNVEERPLD